MFPSFTGNARTRRQVNLSGRTNNPFASTQNALAQAQQERILRQQERERPPAATRIQKTWRGHKGRREARARWRQDWDHKEGWKFQRLPAGGEENKWNPSSSWTPYVSEEECLGSLRLLVQFASPHNDQDVLRLYQFVSRYFRSIPLQQSSCQPDVWTQPFLRLARLSIATLNTKRKNPLPSSIIDALLALFPDLTTKVFKQLAPYSAEYFKTLADLALGHQTENLGLIKTAVIGLLQADTSRAASVYEGFAHEFLTVPDLPAVFGSFEDIARATKYDILAKTLNQLLSAPSQTNILHLKSREGLLWLLAYFIYFRRWAHGQKHKIADSPDVQYVNIVSRLVSYLADDISVRIDAVGYQPEVASNTLATSERSVQPLPAFVRRELLTLISQKNVSGLLTDMDGTSVSDGIATRPHKEASILASYALTLLRAFPRRGDEIRMWLYRGSTSRLARTGGVEMPAIKFFYLATSRTNIFDKISKDPHATVSMLRPDKVQDQCNDISSSSTTESRDQQWRVILLFLELYKFVLIFMDDEEFLSGSTESNSQWSYTRQSALPLEQVRQLTIFLKNLAFSMHWNAAEIAGIEETEAKISLAEYFGGSRAAQPEKGHEEPPEKSAEMSVAGVNGMTLAYMKGMVTGVLRMIYERDSRRKFMPRDHWLMTKYFEMDRFIAAVVAEEEEKHKIEESYGADGESKIDGLDDDDDDDGDERYLVGTQHTQQIRNAARLRRQQQKASRRKYLESVTPRLEILQNMPFFIPFATRVQIFRQFVLLDQIRRRGTSDPDEWRFAMMNSPTPAAISRHRAKVRREHVFEDAFDQFYELGEGLKEPIQIRFVDKFDTVEEGIDGGGVTKEFLTSITNEAFGAGNGLESLFIENDQHLLYPNPTSVEERKYALRQVGFKEGSPDWNENIRDLLRRYEFLGRIIGKCLYEGILVDIHFAPFFLLKWALFGGSGSAPKESGYRANLNDLRDLDEGLYQGLLQLKNYTGNVEDFSLNFEVTDTIRISPTETKSVTKELCPNGASMTVTNENRLVYILNMARHRLQIQPHLQTSAFLRGLSEIISTSWLTMFNQSELQTLVGGSSTEISISDLRANTQYGGLYAIGDDGMEHPCVQMFWKVMEGLDDADRKKVLKFVTSTPRAPLLGFGNLNPRFSLRDSGYDQTRLPSTSTCVNLLKLPVYRDEKVLKERLLYSVNAGAGFNLS